MAGRQRLTAALREPAAVVPHRCARLRRGPPGRRVTVAGHESRVSGGCERVAAEPGQDAAGLPDDLAGPGQGGARGVLAAGDGGAAAVAGGGGAGADLAGLVRGPAQHRRSLPGQLPGGTLAAGAVDGDVQPGEPDRLAGGGEPVFPARPAGQRQRGDRPGPAEPGGQDLRAGQLPGGGQQLAPGTSSRSSRQADPDPGR